MRLVRRDIHHSFISGFVLGFVSGLEKLKKEREHASNDESKQNVIISADKLIPSTSDVA